MEKKLSIIAYKGNGQWFLSMVVKNENFRYLQPLKYDIKSKKQVEAYVKNNYPNYELEFID